MNTNVKVIGLTRLGIKSNPSLQLKRQTLYTTRPSELHGKCTKICGTLYLERSHYYKETHYCNDESRDKMLHSTAVLAYHIFDDYWTSSVLVEIHKNILGGLIQ